MAAPYLTSFNLVKPAELTYDTRPDAFATRSRRCLFVGRSPGHRGRRPRGRSRVPSPDRHIPGHGHLSQRGPSPRRSGRHACQAEQRADVPGPSGSRQGHAVRLRGSRRVALLDEEHRSEEHTSELQSLAYLVCRLLLEKKKKDHMPDRPLITKAYEIIFSRMT